MSKLFIPLEPSLDKCQNEHTKDCFESCINGFYHNKQGEEVQISYNIRNCLSNTITYPPDFQFKLPQLHKPEKGIIEIRYESTLRGIYRMAVEEGKKNIGVLNFASGSYPGGGVLAQSNAQEELLCRSSALYYSMIQGQDFYKYHQEKHDRRASNYLIFSPNCPTWKVDNYQVLDEPILVSYITAAAVNNKRQNFDPDEVKKIHDDRIKTILFCAIQNRVKNLILGAFGCGAFGNVPQDIANSFKHWLVDINLRRYFETVSFSIIERIDKSSNGKVNNCKIFCYTFNLRLIKIMIKVNVQFDAILMNLLHLQKKNFVFSIPYGTKTSYLPALINSEFLYHDDQNEFKFIYDDIILNRNIKYLYNGDEANIRGYEIFIQNNDLVEFIYEENTNDRNEKHHHGGGRYHHKDHHGGGRYHHKDDMRRHKSDK